CKRQDKTKDPNTGKTNEGLVDVFSDVDCHLSFKSSKTQALDGTWSNVGTYKIFCSNKNDVKQNDILEVTTDNTDIYKFTAGKPFRYASHMEIEVSQLSDKG
ncbi:MAG: hypothetical protein ACRC0V_12940, partial [Fusobacteriaceae bacterium]